MNELSITHQCESTTPHCEEGQRLHKELMAALNVADRIEWEWGTENAKEELLRVHRARQAYYKHHIPHCPGGTL